MNGQAPPPAQPNGQGPAPALPDAQQQFFSTLVNRLNDRQPPLKSIPCSIFKTGQDFDQWLNVLRDNIKAVNRLTDQDQARLDELCRVWIPTKLEVGSTRAVYDNLEADVKANWARLRDALSNAFRDDTEMIAFLNNEGAYRRAPGVSLRDFKNGLIMRMEKFQSGLKNVQQEWERTAVRRFRAGLDNPILAAHILMSCTGTKHNLESAFNVAVNYENTISTLSQSDGIKTVDPTMASMLPIPQMNALSLEPPQFSVLSSQQEKRVEALETSQKKQEMDITEVKANVIDVKENLKQIKEEITRPKVFQRQFYRPQARPPYPAPRAPMQNPSFRSYYPNQNRFAGARPQFTSGLSGGPGYVTHQPATANQRTLFKPNGQTDRPALEQQGAQGASGPVLAAVEGREEGKFDQMSFPNPNLQCGSYDFGQGWVGDEASEAVGQGYELQPEGVFVYSEMPF